MEIMLNYLNLEIRKDPKEGSDWLWPIDEIKCWQLSNIVKLRTAGLEDATL